MRIIDVSHHQGYIHWDEVAKDPQQIEGVFIKATQGVGYTDPALRLNAIEAKKEGLKIGYYHYATLSSEDVVKDAISEANYFLSVLSHYPKPDYPLVLDIEENKAHLHTDQVLTWVNTFFDTLKNSDHNNYALYSYTPFINANFPAGHNLENIPLWIAAYVNKPVPTLPSAWKHFYLWQYSCKGSVKGIKGFVDMNKMPDNSL